MKKILIVILAVLIILNTACSKKIEESNIYVIVNGDIQENMSLIYTDFKQVKFTEDNANYIYGVKLSDILAKTTLISSDNYIMITAKDGTSAMIEAEAADLCYIVEGNDVLSVKAPNHPRVVGIKDIYDITVISKEYIDVGLKIVGQEDRTISSGNSKLLLFEKTGENKKNGNIAYKYKKIESISVFELIDKEGYLYFKNGDIAKINKEDKGALIWQNNGISYINGDNNYQGLIGVLSNVNNIIYDTYNVMKQSIDNDKKVLFILTDGFSYEQAEYFNDSLKLLSEGYRKCASVNPAISNVALASIVTGYSPYNTDILKRGIKAPAKQDIFSYVESKGKKSVYIEGDGNLIITSINPILNISDKNGHTDTNVYLSAKKALKDSPDLLFVHFHGIDDVNHKYSPLSDNAKAKIIEVEEYVTDLIKEFKGTVIIVSDHGSVTIEADNIKTGKHGIIRSEDMLVPLYIINRG